MGKWILLKRTIDDAEVAINLDNVREIVPTDDGSRIEFTDEHNEVVTVPLWNILHAASEQVFRGTEP